MHVGCMWCDYVVDGTVWVVHSGHTSSCLSLTSHIVMKWHTWTPPLFAKLLEAMVVMRQAR